MKKRLAKIAIAATCGALGLGAAQSAGESALPPVRIILVGDSTVALRNGWGPGFCANVAPQVTCVDVAKNGASTASYRAEGLWSAVLEKLKSEPGFSASYVLIQFGHNDQPGKPGRSTDLATEFPANLHRYVREVKAAGGKPILLTPLVRRIFQDGRVTNNLAPWAAATKKVGEEEGVPVLDLNTESAAAVQQMGPVEANTLAMAPPPAEIAASAASGNSQPAPKVAQPEVRATSDVQGNAKVEPKGDPVPVFDYTHLGDKGSVYFGRMVGDELGRAVPELGPYLGSRGMGR